MKQEMIFLSFSEAEAEEEKRQPEQAVEGVIRSRFRRTGNRIPWWLTGSQLMHPEAGKRKKGEERKEKEMGQEMEYITE